MKRSSRSGHQVGALFIAVLIGAFIALPTSRVSAQPDDSTRFEVRLVSRTLIPQPGMDLVFKDTLTAQIQRGQTRHIYVQLKRNLSRGERAELEKQGVKLLSYIGSYTWYATLTGRRALAFTVTDTVRAAPILQTMRWVGRIEPADRLAPELLQTGAERWYTAEGNREKYSVYFFKDIPMDSARQIVHSLGGEIDGEETLTKGFFIKVKPGIRDRLMSRDEVKLIDLYPPPPIDYNDGGRAWCGTDIVHTAGYNGAGVVLGLREATGHPENTHLDLTAARCHREDVGGISRHATHVCGTIIGSGAANAARMGHAPGINDIRCYIVDNVGPADEMAVGYHNHGITATNNSWGYAAGWVRYNPPGPDPFGWYFEPYSPQATFGDYRWSCPAFDQLVRDSGLIIVFASGNERNDPDDGSETAAQPGDWDQIAGAGAGSWDGYHTVVPVVTAKNVITVGAINDATDAMSVFSSWGPTDDGRLKPEIAAPGVAISSCDSNDGDNNGSFDDYYPSDGTSMAAPAVTGIVALLIQSYREEYLGATGLTETPYPSTIKAILCQSAEDMIDNPDAAGPDLDGPDYVYGYGGVRADAARQLIVDRKFREGIIATEDDRDVYEIVVNAGDEVRITLAWDDYPAGAANPDPTIINDIDLVLQDPAGTYYTPWNLHITAHDQVVNAATRNTHAVASTDLIAEVDRDRWNNVEQVFVDSDLLGGAPVPTGTWNVIVEPHTLPESPQRYSLAGSHVMEGVVEI
ncbi:MAG: S8 family serine peptidase, partial [Candidatus Zixiibacteriota bacterium]